METQIQKPPLTTASLKGYILGGAKKPSELKVGVEWEKIGIDRRSGKAIPYFGPSGVRRIFTELQTRFGWQPLYSSSGNPIALNKGPSAITLEPGGQIELSGRTASSIRENAAELYCHLKEIREVSDPLGIAWLGIGAQPFSTQDEIEWVPKDRYVLMQEKLRREGQKTYAMMKETASVQVSLDFTGEGDALEKFRLAMALAPVLTGLFANSPLEKGKAGGYLSRRAAIWAETDPRRSGVLWEALEADYSLDDYVRYALGVPMLFIQRDGLWLGVERLTFGEYMEKGWKGYQAEPEDWELHLTSIFTECRLKTYLEIRSVDCQVASMGLGAVAFLKGLLYCESSRRQAWRLLAPLSTEDRKKWMADAPSTGLRCRTSIGSALEIARELCVLAAEGLKENGTSGIAEGDLAYLEPVQNLLKEGVAPAERLLACYLPAANREEQVQRVLQCAAV